MSRLARLIVIVVAMSTTTGCCMSFYERLQNGWLWNHPRRDHFAPGPPPPRTTPPGPTTPAALPPPPGVK
jgi:hypothetical protein